MYKQNEIPEFKAAICYFDEHAPQDLPIKLKEILEKHGYFPSVFINADRLTRGRYLRYKDKMYSYLEDMYGTKDIVYLALKNCDNLNAASYWHMTWSATFYKSSSSVAHKPWNILSFSITYDKLQDESEYNKFFDCVKDCISLVHPVYARIDDVDMNVTMSQVTGQNRVMPTKYGEVKAINWGNYFSEEYCKTYNLTPECLSNVKYEIINNGIYFTLTDSALDYASKECLKKRKQLVRRLGIKPPNLLFR